GTAVSRRQHRVHVARSAGAVRAISRVGGPPRMVRHGPLVVHVVGARPNYMKVAPVYAALQRSGAVEQRLLHTGQHYDSALNDVFFDELPLPTPHLMLEVGSGTHGEQTGKALIGLEQA